MSLATAGRVLRNESYPVDKVLSERVRQVASLLGYVPNIHARSLRGGAPSMVGLIIGDMVEPYYAEIAEAITQHLGRLLPVAFCTGITSVTPPAQHHNADDDHDESE